MEEREKAKNQEEKLVTNEGEEEPLLKGSQICPLWAFATPGRKFRWHTANGRKLRSEKLEKRIMAGTSAGSPELPVGAKLPVKVPTEVPSNRHNENRRLLNMSGTRAGNSTGTFGLSGTSGHWPELPVRAKLPVEIPTEVPSNSTSKTEGY